MNVFFKTNTLSEIFVHLSVQWWHFSAPFQTVKILIFATFSVGLPACPDWRNFELFPHIKQIPSHHEVPTQFPGVFLSSPLVRRPPSHRTYPFNFSTDIQSFLSFRGTATTRSFSTMKSFIFAINRYLYRTKSPLVQDADRASLGGLLGMDWGLFSLRKSSWQGRI